MIRFMISCAIAMIVFSCSESPSSERTDGYSKRPASTEDSLFDEVMHGHDTAMAKMGKLDKYREKVKEKMDSLGKKAASASKATLETTLKDLDNKLKDAKEGMDKWMDDFSIDSAQDNTERRIEYLKSEKLKVDDVKKKIFETIAKADSLLKK